MRCGLSRKCRNRNSWHNRPLWKKLNLFEDLENQENFSGLENFQLNKSNDATHYLYADPSFMRLEGGHEQQEVYYDCVPCEGEPVHDHNFLQPQLQIFEVINELKNPKEFKGFLKQMAFNAQILYNSFRQAYCEAKKSKQSLKQNVCVNCGETNENLAKQYDRGDLKPGRKTSNRQEISKRNKQHDEKFESVCKNKISSRITCPSCGKLKKRSKENICPLCSGVLEDDFKKSENIKDDSNCLKETNLCQEYEKDLQHLSYSERCAVLRGEMPWPTKASEESQTSQELKSTEICLSSTEVGKSQHLSLNPVCVTIPVKLQIDGQNCQTRVLETEIVLGSTLDHGQGKLSTSIKKPQCPQDMSFSFDQEPNFPKLPQFKREPKSPHHWKVPDNKPVKLLTDSDTFHSCVSNSVTSFIKPAMEPRQQPPFHNEKALNEMMELLKNHFKSFKETTASLPPPTTPLREIKTQSQTKGIQSSFIDTPLPKATYSRTDFTQTAEPLKPAVIPIPAPITAATSSQYDPRIKAEKLRGELFEEVQTTLEKKTAKDALKAFSQGKQFTLSANKQTTEMPIATKLIKSFSPEVAIPTNAASPQPLTSMAVTTMADSKPQLTKKPDIAPKPIDIPPLPPLAKQSEFPSTSQELNSKPELPPKPSFIPKPPPPPAAPKLKSETQQTDISSVKASGHYKRNEIRQEIQEEMRDILQQSSSKAGKKYRATERAEILQDFNKLINPEKSEHSSQQINRENALQNIRYLIEAVGPTTRTLQPSESQVTILENIRYIIDPKNTPKTAKRKKYNKETKEKILEDLHLLIKPHEGKKVDNREVRKHIIHDLRFMLETGQETFSPQRPPRSPDIGPESSRAQQMRQERQQKSPNEIRDSVLADMAKVLDVSTTGVGPDSSRAQHLREERQQKSPNEIRDSILADIAKVLDDGSTGVVPSSSRAEQLRQERQQKSPNEIRDSVLADLVNILEPTTNRQQVKTNLEESSLTKRQTSENVANQRRKNKSVTSLSSNVSSYKSFD